MPHSLSCCWHLHLKWGRVLKLGTNPYSWNINSSCYNSAIHTMLQNHLAGTLSILQNSFVLLHHSIISSLLIQVLEWTLHPPCFLLMQKALWHHPVKHRIHNNWIKLSLQIHKQRRIRLTALSEWPNSIFSVPNALIMAIIDCIVLLYTTCLYCAHSSWVYPCSWIILRANWISIIQAKVKDYYEITLLSKSKKLGTVPDRQKWWKIPNTLELEDHYLPCYMLCLFS